MCMEAVSHPVIEHATNPYTYQSAESIQDVISALQVLTATGTERVALVTIKLHFAQEGKNFAPRTSYVEQSVRYFLDSIRPLVRKTDSVFLLGHTYHFLLLGADLQGGNIVQERLWEALLWRVHGVHDTHETEILRPYAMTIGHSAYPEPASSFEQCVAAAGIIRVSADLRPEKATRQRVVQQQEQQEKDAELPALARQLGIPYLPLLPRKLPAKVKKLVSPALAQELNCYPIGRERDTLTVAMANPQDSLALDHLHRETGLHIFPVLTHPQELQSAIAGLQTLSHR